MRTLKIIAILAMCFAMVTPAFALMDYEDNSMNNQQGQQQGIANSGNSMQGQQQGIANSGNSSNRNRNSNRQGQGQAQGQIGINKQGQGQIGSVETNVDSHDEATFIPAAATNPNIGQGGMAASSPFGGVAVTTSEQGRLNQENINALIALKENGVFEGKEELFNELVMEQWESMREAAKPKLPLGILPIQGNPILDLISFRFSWGNNNNKKHERVDTDLSTGNRGNVGP